MNKAVPTPAATGTAKTDNDYEAEVDFYLTEMKHLQKRLAEDGEEIKALQEETRASLYRLMTNSP